MHKHTHALLCTFVLSCIVIRTRQQSDKQIRSCLVSHEYTRTHIQIHKNTKKDTQTHAYIVNASLSN